MGKIKQFLLTVFLLFQTSITFAQEAIQMVYDKGSKASSTGVSAIWILANISYAGMRAQYKLAKDINVPPNSSTENQNPG